jgi:hypothetical protein
MKKFTNLLIVASLALAGAVMAQDPTPEESKAPGKKPDKKAPAEVKPKGPQAPKTEAPKTEAPKTEAPKTEAPAMKEAPPKDLPPTTKPEKAEKPDKKAPPTKPAPETKAPATTEQPATSATTAPKKEKPTDSRKDKKAPAANATTAPSVSPAATTASVPATRTTATPTPAAATTTATAAPATASATPATAATMTPAAGATTTPAAAASTTPATTASATAAPSVSQSNQTTAVNPTGATKKLEVQKVEQIRQRHATFRAQPRPDRAPAVTFSANFRLPGSEQWQGPRYEVYRSYRPERHDQGWYRSKYQRVELIAGGYYYFNNGYWYPAWGYNPTNEYYAYDAPIYAGKHAEPPDKVIANVQAALQEMGYYKGEVDGLLGPLTREALTGYQRDQGMVVTAVIDEPTLDALGMG